jgi:hypothetical protein
MKLIGFACVKNIMYWTSTPADNGLVWGINQLHEARKLGSSSLYRGAVMPVRYRAW